jgi:hypothetical protein
MSIKVQISNHVEAGTLYALSPAIAHDNSQLKRGVFVSDEVWNLVGDDVPVSEELERVSGQARSRLDSFSLGRSVVFAMHPRQKSVHSDIARNAPIESGIVDVRITNPEPTLRIFGGFAGRDILVLLTWKHRKDLDFEVEVTRCKLEWGKFFPGNIPLIGTTNDEYISGKFIPG